MEELGRLPPDLADTYAQIFEHVKRLGSQSRGIAERSLKWLMCQARELSEAEFLAAVSMGSERESVNLTKETILFICGNLVMYDHELKVFRFAHLSVREYLETQSEFTLGAAHALAAEMSLLVCLHRDTEPAAKPTRKFRRYAILFWLYHCQEAKKSTLSDSLHQLLEDFLQRREETNLYYAVWVQSLYRTMQSCHERSDITDEDSINGTPKEWRPDSSVWISIPNLAEIDKKDKMLGSILGSHSCPYDPTFAACFLGLPRIVEQNLQSMLSSPANNRNEAGVNREVFGPTNMRRQTYLHVACQHGSIDLLRLLLQCPLWVRSKDIWRRTALHYAVNPYALTSLRVARRIGAVSEAHDQIIAAEMVAMIELLIEKGSNVDAGDCSKKTALHHASSTNLVTGAQALLEHGASIDAKTLEGQTPLHLAAKAGNTAVTKLLLQSKANIEARDGYDRTPLLLATQTGHTAVVRLLLQSRADIEARDRFRMTPLLQAAQSGHTAVAQLLLQCKADIEARGRAGETPLFNAVAQGEVDTVRLFLLLGADINATKVCGSTPLHVALEPQSTTDGVYSDKYFNIFRLLVDAGADIEMSDDEGRTPLHLAAQIADKASIQILLNQGANIKTEDSMGLLPLDHAAGSGSLAVFSILFKRWTDVMAESSASAVEAWLHRSTKPVKKVKLENLTNFEILQDWRNMSLEDLVELTTPGSRIQKCWAEDGPRGLRSLYRARLIVKEMRARRGAQPVI